MKRALAILVACGSPAPPAPTVEPACAPAPSPITGTATHYAADGTGKCSFERSDGYVVAMSPVDYAHGLLCGACIVVTGPDGSEIVVRVTDRCPACKPGTIDLGREAFALLAPLAKGRIPITWQPVPCDVSGPIGIHFKDRSNAFWIAVQLRNHRYPIASLEAREATGSYRRLDRADYNYFISTKGLGAGPIAVRATDTRGHVIVADAITVGAAVTRDAATQFPLCR
ncbi:MAG: expansin EXLX1 family cellulose-binding protein [Kofleriaceae bacterium]